MRNCFSQQYVSIEMATGQQLSLTSDKFFAGII